MSENMVHRNGHICDPYPSMMGILYWSRWELTEELISSPCLLKIN